MAQFVPAVTYSYKNEFYIGLWAEVWRPSINELFTKSPSQAEPNVFQQMCVCGRENFQKGKNFTPKSRKAYQFVSASM